MLTSSNAAAAVISFLTLLISTIYNPLEVLGVYGVFVVTVAAFQLVAGRLEHAIVRSASKRAALEIKSFIYVERRHNANNNCAVSFMCHVKYYTI